MTIYDNAEQRVGVLLSCSHIQQYAQSSEKSKELLQEKFLKYVLVY